MKKYIDCWISVATTLFSQALAGEPQLRESTSVETEISNTGFVTDLSGDITGQFTVTLDSEILRAPLLGEGINQISAWAQFLREVAEAAARELAVNSGVVCRIESIREAEFDKTATRAFRLETPQESWTVLVHDQTRGAMDQGNCNTGAFEMESTTPGLQPGPGLDLLLEVEVEATLRFGCREMPLSEILELGPGDVIELDRHISDPADLIVGGKLVARGEVVLMNGNFGLRVTEVAAPQKRLESIRCLF